MVRHLCNASRRIAVAAAHHKCIMTQLAFIWQGLLGIFNQKVIFKIIGQHFLGTKGGLNLF
jgi:hypothetical protein